jgi:hypothetical protein
MSIESLLFSITSRKIAIELSRTSKTRVDCIRSRWSLFFNIDLMRKIESNSCGVDCQCAFDSRHFPILRGGEEKRKRNSRSRRAVVDGLHRPRIRSEKNQRSSPKRKVFSDLQVANLLEFVTFAWVRSSSSNVGITSSPSIPASVSCLHRTRSSFFRALQAAR